MSCPIVNAPCGRLSNVPEVSDAKQSYAYLSIPFAKPPVGDLRFEPPEKNEPWEGILNATIMPPGPSQSRDTLKSVKNLFVICNQYNSNFENFAEDCLYLNVFSSNPSKSANMPVLFWIYGGGFQAGGIEYFDPQVLCSLHNVVVVMPNYRVNVFGFLTLGPGTKYKGNMGLKDQILAMEWVRDNIREFGGNPENVTLFGQSAGSVSVSCHMVSPVSRQLFHKSIHHSGTINIPVLIQKDYPVYREAFLKCLGILETEPEEIMKKLKNLSIHDITKAQDEAAKTTKFFAGVIDGEIIPDNPKTMLKKKAYSEVPSIIGCNNTEAAGMLSMGIPGYTDGFSEEFVRILLKGNLINYVEEEKLEEALETTMEFYCRNLEGNDKMKWSKLYSNFLGDSWFVATSIEQANIHSEISGGNTYLYYMTHQLQLHHNDSYGKADKKPDFCEGDHGDDMIFTFGYPLYNGPTTFDLKYSKDEKELSQKWMTYLTNFAKTGNPNEGNNVDVQWPKYNVEAKQYITFKNPLTVKDNLCEEAFKFWTETIPAL